MLAALALFFVLAIGRGLWRGTIPLNSAVVVIGYIACILVFAAASYSAVPLLLEIPCWIRLEADEHQLTLVTRRWTTVGRHALARDDLVRAVGSPDVPISVEPIWNVWLELKDSPEPLRVRIHRSQDPIAFGELMTQLKQFTVIELSTTPSRPADAIT